MTTDACCTTPTTATGRQSVEPSAGSCCAPHVEGASVFEEVRREEIPPDVAAIRNAGFRLLLEHGEPVSVSALAAATGLSSHRVGEIFDSVRARGRVEFNDQDELIGIAGLSLTPSRHRLTVGTTTRWTWCALDAVGILGALRATGHVTSTDPHTGDTITVDFTDGNPARDVHLFILGGFGDGSVREEWCPQVNFFTTHDDAQDWVTAHGLDGDIVSVVDIAADAAEMWRPVVDLA